VLSADLKPAGKSRLRKVAKSLTLTEQHCGKLFRQKPVHVRFISSWLRREGRSWRTILCS